MVGKRGREPWSSCSSLSPLNGDCMREIKKHSNHLECYCSRTMHTLACKYTHYLTLVTLCVQGLLCARHNCLLTTHIGVQGLLCTPQLFINNTSTQQHKHIILSLSWGLPNMNQDLWLARPIANQGKNPERTLKLFRKNSGKTHYHEHSSITSHS